MRVAVWFIAFAVLPFLFGTADGAFAHSAAAHAHVTNTAYAQGTVAAPLEISTDADAGTPPGEFLSTFDAQPASCPHGQSRSDCGSCSACSANASVAIVTVESAFRDDQGATIGIAAATAFRLRQAVFELSRPPKSFA